MMSESIYSYKIIENLGEGSFGEVKKVRCEKDNKIYAIKKVKFNTNEDSGIPRTTYNEIKILKELDYKNIVKLVEVINYENDIYLVFEFCEYDLLKLKYGIREQKDLVKCLFRQVALGLFYLHQCNIIHRDIKPSNIFVNKDKIVKLGDFGMSIHSYDLREEGKRTVVTTQYRPPELCLGADIYGPEIDIWGLGCVLYEIITKEILFEGKYTDNHDEANREQIKSIGQKCGAIRDWEEAKTLPKYESYYNSIPQNEKSTWNSDLRKFLDGKIEKQYEHAKDLILKMLQYNPKKRITAKEVYSHEFLKNENNLPQDLRDFDLENFLFRKK